MRPGQHETQLGQWSLIWVCIYQWLVWGVSLQYKQWFTHSNGLLWIKANEAWGSLLTNGEPRRRQHALSGGLHPNLQDRGGIFPSRWEADVSLFSVSSHRPCFCLLSSFGRTWPSAPSSPPRDRGGTWAPWEGWLSLSSITWRGRAFCGRHCIRYRAVSTWSRSKCSQLSHGINANKIWF